MAHPTKRIVRISSDQPVELVPYVQHASQCFRLDKGVASTVTRDKLTAVWVETASRGSELAVYRDRDAVHYMGSAWRFDPSATGGKAVDADA